MASTRLAAVAALLLAAATAFGEGVSPTLDFTSVQLEVNWVQHSSEIAAARARYGNKATVGPINGRENGFSALVRIGEQYICRIYVLAPKKVDDERTLVIGHEVLHCLKGAYH